MHGTFNGVRVSAYQGQIAIAIPLGKESMIVMVPEDRIAPHGLELLRTMLTDTEPLLIDSKVRTEESVKLIVESHG